MRPVDPERVVLVNVTTSESMTVLMNPRELQSRVNVGYNRHVVPGLSHQVLQYQGTGNRELPGVEFYLDRLFADDQPDTPDIREFERHVLALTVPPGGTQGVADTRPPRALFIWPNVLTLEAVVTSVAFRWQQFARDGRALVYTATVTLEEILDRRRTSEIYRWGV